LVVVTRRQQLLGKHPPICRATLRAPRSARRTTIEIMTADVAWAAQSSEPAGSAQLRAILSKIESIKFDTTFLKISPRFSRLFIHLYFKLKRAT